MHYWGPFERRCRHIVSISARNLQQPTIINDHSNNNNDNISSNSIDNEDNRNVIFPDSYFCMRYNNSNSESSKSVDSSKCGANDQSDIFYTSPIVKSSLNPDWPSVIEHFAPSEDGFYSYYTDWPAPRQTSFILEVYLTCEGTDGAVGEGKSSFSQLIDLEQGLVALGKQPLVSKSIISSSSSNGGGGGAFAFLLDLKNVILLELDDGILYLAPVANSGNLSSIATRMIDCTPIEGGEEQLNNLISKSENSKNELSKNELSKNDQLNGSLDASMSKSPSLQINHTSNFSISENLNSPIPRHVRSRSTEKSSSGGVRNLTINTAASANNSNSASLNLNPEKRTIGHPQQQQQQLMLSSISDLDGNSQNSQAVVVAIQSNSYHQVASISRKLSYDLDLFLRMHNQELCLDEETRALKQSSKPIEEQLEQMKPILDRYQQLESVGRLLDQEKQTKIQLKGNLIESRNRILALKAEVQEKREILAKKREASAKESKERAIKLEIIESNRRALVKLQRMVEKRRARMIQSCLEIFPIHQYNSGVGSLKKSKSSTNNSTVNLNSINNGNPNAIHESKSNLFAASNPSTSSSAAALFTIGGLPIPAAESEHFYSESVFSEPFISTSISYVTSLVTVLCKYYECPVRFPISQLGSRSVILDSNTGLGNTASSKDSPFTMKNHLHFDNSTNASNNTLPFNAHANVFPLFLMNNTSTEIYEYGFHYLHRVSANTNEGKTIDGGGNGGKNGAMGSSGGGGASNFGYLDWQRRFEFGLYLLNRNIQQLIERNGTEITDLRNTLLNLYQWLNKQLDALLI